MDLPNILLVLVLLIVIYQDLKIRAIHVTLPIIIFVIATIINYRSLELNFYNIAYNSIFILINIIGLFAYASYKSKGFANPINASIGIGDILFFIAITPLFTLRPFILFFILGLIFSLVIHLSLSAFQKTKTIPLAGYLSLFLVITLLIKHTFNSRLLS